MRAEHRRRRWVLPVVLLAASGAVVAHRVRAAAVPQDTARPVPPTPVAPAAPADPAPADPADRAVATAALQVPRRGVVTLVEPPVEDAPVAGGPLPARSDGSSPDPEYTIKGNGGSRVYHPPSSPYYGRTRAEVWFRTVEDAEAAGFRPHRSRRPD